MKQNQLKVFIFISAITWFAIYALTFGKDGITQELASAALKPFPLVCTFMAFLSYLFEHYLWKWPVINSLLADNRRNIGGTWQLTLHSNWKNPSTNLGVPPIEAYMRVYQTFSHLEMKQMTKESESFSTSSNMICQKNGLCDVSIVYSNEPRGAIRDRSPIHYGAFRIRVSGSPATSMEGTYWTDRNTTGEIHFTQRNAKLYDNFQSAKDSFPTFEGTSISTHFDEDLKKANEE